MLSVSTKTVLRVTYTVQLLHFVALVCCPTSLFDLHMVEPGNFAGREMSLMVSQVANLLLVAGAMTAAAAQGNDDTQRKAVQYGVMPFCLSRIFTIWRFMDLIKTSMVPVALAQPIIILALAIHSVYCGCCGCKDKKP